MIHQGSVTKDMFINWLREEVLEYCTPYPGPQSVLVMDNALIHRDPKVREMCDDAGIRLEYLPPYSPDFNPIEASFHDLKQYIRSRRFDVDSFDTFGDFLRQSVEDLVGNNRNAKAHFKKACIPR